MPLKYSLSKNKSAVNKAVSENIHELTHNGKKKRSHKQKVAIAIRAATHKPKHR